MEAIALSPAASKGSIVPRTMWESKWNTRNTFQQIVPPLFLIRSQWWWCTTTTILVQYPVRM